MNNINQIYDGIKWDRQPGSVAASGEMGKDDTNVEMKATIA